MSTVRQAAPILQIHAEVTRQIRQHARSSMSTEVCGVLIGLVVDDLHADAAAGEVKIFAAIPAVNAAQAGTHVTFTQDAWEHIYKVKDATYPDDRILGWYHSHPGFGVFLSEHDTFIHENFFSASNQVAWVFDPHTDEEGCFGWVDGSIARVDSLTIIDGDAPADVGASRELATSGAASSEDLSDSDVETTPKHSHIRTGRLPRWVRWAASASALLAALLLGFTVSHLLFPSLYPLVLPMNPISGKPLLRDPKHGEPVYMDPQTGKYVVLGRSGRLTSIDPGTLTTAQPPAADNPLPPPQQTAPSTPPPASKELHDPNLKAQPKEKQ